MQVHTFQTAAVFQRNAETISVVILNYNKREFLAKCIASVLEIDWPNLDVIVVDNASSDGSAEMVKSEFPNRVRLITREVNSPTAGRNQGFAAAKGEFVLSIDNDIVLPDKHVLQKGIDLLRRFPSVGLLAFKIGTVDRPDEPLPEHWWYPLPLEKWKDRFFYTDFFSEGAVLFRAEMLAETGGYDDDFFQYFESVDLSLRIIRDGFDMLYCPVLTCAELRVRGFLPRKRTPINYLSLRNRLWVVWKHYPLGRGIRFALGRILIAGVRSVRYGWVDYFVRGVKDGIAAPRTIRAKRRPLDEKTWKRIKEIRQGRVCAVDYRTEA